jgi:hypothetical protein
VGEVLFKQFAQRFGFILSFLCAGIVTPVELGKNLGGLDLRPFAGIS